VGSPLQPTLHTVGHSTHAIEEFIGILEAHGIDQLVDIRTIPKSRHNPQFNREALAASLKASGIVYRHLPGLGGLRRPRPDSINTAWRNTSFRGYADYMQTDEFRACLQQLMEFAATKPTAIMCAEAVPWRCHRSLVADALTARGIRVIDILTESKAQAHSMTPFARLDGDRVIYPKEPSASDRGPNLDLFAQES